MPDTAVTTDKARLDRDDIHCFLETSYWAAGMPDTVLARSIAHSCSLGPYKNERQIGFARVVPNETTFADLADVFVDPDEQHQDCGTRLITALLAHAKLQGLRRGHLISRDARCIYRQMAFPVLARPGGQMEKCTPPTCGGGPARDTLHDAGRSQRNG